MAAFAPRAGQGDGQGDERTRPQECSALLEPIAHAISDALKTIHLVCDHVSTHQSKAVSTGLGNHPRLVVHFTPVHGAWLNQVAQWWRLLQRQRWRWVDFASKAQLRQKLEPLIRAWEGACASVQLVQEIRRQGHGGRTCHGRLIASYWIRNPDELYLEPIPID